MPIKVTWLSKLYNTYNTKLVKINFLRTCAHGLYYMRVVNIIAKLSMEAPAAAEILVDSVMVQSYLTSPMQSKNKQWRRTASHCRWPLSFADLTASCYGRYCACCIMDQLNAWKKLSASHINQSCPCMHGLCPQIQLAHKSLVNGV